MKPKERLTWKDRLSPEYLLDTPGLSWLGQRLLKPKLWTLDRGGLARGVAVGIYIAWIPMPFQMLLAVPTAVFLNANLPASIISVWISNPLTWLPMFTIAYQVGSLVLHPPADTLLQILSNASWAEIIELAPETLKVALTGALILQIVTTALGFLLVLLFWDGCNEIYRNWRDERPRPD
ncbi:MAG: DUF2062 domain-containing protein [Gammaproteobacteria bacterium]